MKVDPITGTMNITSEILPHPSEYGLPHESWRKHGYETVEKLLAKHNGSVTFLSAPTGSGKTSYARALAEKMGATAFVKTKLLQLQYENIYNFDLMFGRANYPCVHPDRLDSEASAAECLYELKMDQCEYSEECPYLLQKNIVQESSVRVLNYAYLLSAKWPRDKKYATTYAVYDEAHILPDETLEFVGCTIRESDRVRWRLDGFPSCYDSSHDSLMWCLDWLERSIGVIETEIATLKSDDISDKAKKSRGERFAGKLKATAAAVHRSADDWFVRSGLRALDVQGGKAAGLFLKPLTARYHFPRLFLGVYPRVVMMSATLGNVSDLAEELGVAGYEYDSVPNQWPADSRPVHVLDVPSMGMKATESARVEHAEQIAKALKGLPGDWSGVIHTTSWQSAFDLTKRLVKAGIPNKRLFIPSRGNTKTQLEEWEQAKKKQAGALVVTPTFNQGVDLLEERICIIAKTPFPYCAPGTYEYEKMMYSNKFYRWTTASDLEQRCGRTRRGRDEDYDDSFHVRGYVAIADGSFKRMGLGKSCSRDFNDSLVFD